MWGLGDMCRSMQEERRNNLTTHPRHISPATNEAERQAKRRKHAELDDTSQENVSPNINVLTF